MRHVTVQRGAVLMAGKRIWLFWTPGDRPVCIPIRTQRVPRSRWDYRLRAQDASSLIGRELMVCGREARAIDTNGMVLAGSMTGIGLAALEITLRRAAESEAVEARYRL